ncbi:MAG TPA: hypothetical protein VGI90_09880 [Steroidobacteraceae bacterium]|jgi:hypothetical protein
MTQESMPILQAWRKEISDEYAAGRETIKTAEAELASAALASRTAGEIYRATKALLMPEKSFRSRSGALVSRAEAEPLEPLLILRLRDLEDKFKETSRLERHLCAQVVGLREQLKKCEKALAQLDRRLAPADAAEVA